MSKFLLKIEAVNLANFISDCNDLSTIRGGGLLLLRAPDAAAAAFPTLEKIYQGASTGLYKFEGSPEQARQLRFDIEAKVHAGPRQEATIMVDVAPLSGDSNAAFQEAWQTVIANGRLRQMTSPSVIFPRLSNTSAPDPVCALDRVRPAAVPAVLPNSATPTAVSTSISARREHGRKQKQAFYEKESGVTGLRFVNDFEQLSNDPDQGNLHHKMAVVYLDGNGFGAILRSCPGTTKLGAWSELLLNNQRAVLSALLKSSGRLQHWNYWNADNKRSEFRLETLLWGGDEIMWVVPAWTAWELICHFHTKYGRRVGRVDRFFDPDGKGPQPLHFSGAIVFCHHNAPIHRITHLAKELAEEAKSRAKSEPGDWFAYQVLESFDHLGSDIESARRKLCPPDTDLKHLLIPGHPVANAPALADVPQLMEQLRLKLPRNKVHEVARGLLTGAAVKADATGDTTLKRADDPIRQAFDQLEALLSPGQRRATWIHIDQLWDYTPVPSSATIEEVRP